MSRRRTVVTWSAGLLATAAAALLTASAVLPGSAANLDVDGGVLQVFLLDGPDDVPGPPDDVPVGPPEQVPGPPDGLPGGPPDGLPHGPPEGVPAEPTTAGPPSGTPDETDSVDGSGDLGDSDTSGESSTAPGPPEPQQQQSDQGSQAEDPATTSASAPTTKSEVRYENCAAAREAGAAPLEAEDPGYRPELDDDRDGRACEEGEGRL